MLAHVKDSLRYHLAARSTPDRRAEHLLAVLDVFDDWIAEHGSPGERASFRDVLASAALHRRRLEQEQRPATVSDSAGITRRAVGG